MIRVDVKDIVNLSEGILENREFYNIPVEGVSIDTREINKNNLYIPIVGEKFDGHKFVLDAIEKGASACLWNKNIDIPDLDFPFILVEDTLEALKTLAVNYKNTIENLKLIGITGSNGKTTTKDIMEGVMSKKYKTVKTKGNFNNMIGVPLTLLSLNHDTEVGIIEMGTDGFGQIKELTNMVNPDIAMITNIGKSHLDLLKNKENVARAKFEILDGLKSNGHFIYNNDDDTLNKVIKEYDIKQDLINYGVIESSDYRLELIEEGIEGIKFKIYEGDISSELSLPMLGRHNMYNAACAIIVARILGLTYDEIQDGFYNIKKTDMRNDIMEAENFTILNDAYKSNPNSLLAALDTLESIKGFESKAVVLGDMLDLGDEVESIHEEVGKKIKPEVVDQIFTIGDLAKHIAMGALENFNSENLYHANTKKELVDKINKYMNKDSLVLFKASRSV
ncbi:MAG TPA: UDP-N-acetylmuramoyl-tripeptide--D-alanyl-D-alanine ligase, partial [Tissierellaceae bacterium]